MASKFRIAERGFIYHLSVLALILVPHSIYSFYLVKTSPAIYLFNIAARDGLIILIIYTNLYFLIPYFFKRGRYLLYFTLIGLLVGLFIFVSWELGAYLARLMKYTDESFFFTFISSFFNIAQYLLISFLLFNLREKFDQEKKMDAIALEKLKTEINYLRAQINPHFLFNTLNNLYALSLEKSEKTPEIILRLSKIMDYMLYESDDALGYLYKDIENLEDYIGLERIRQGNEARIDFRVTGITASQRIVPLLLLPLVENGFKHGIHSQIHDAWLEVDLQVEPHAVELKVVNSFRRNGENGRSGIGLVNLKRRLELFYPEKHSLETVRSDHEFSATLKIILE